MASQFVPSPQQREIFDFIQNGTGHAIVIAVAGSGKSTTLVNSLPYISPRDRVIMLAFNASIAKELQERVAGYSNVTARTFHSVGYGLLAKYLNRKISPDPKKCIKLFETHYGTELAAKYGLFCANLASYAKGEGLGAIAPLTEAGLLDLVEHHELELTAEDSDVYTGAQLTMELIKLSNRAAEQGSVDFDDLLYLPLLWDLKFFQYNFVFVDEAQDTNPTRREFAKRMIRPRYGRSVWVGDPKQSIYGFTGASSDAMDLIKRDFRATTLGLTFSYRCPQEVVKAAQQYVPYIQAHPDAPKGHFNPKGVVLDSKGEERIFDIRSLTSEDAILCRNTAPLVKCAYWLIANNVACVVLGREIGQGLVNFIKKFKGQDLDEVLDKMEEQVGEQVAQLRLDKKDHKADALEDKKECILAITESLPGDDYTVEGIIRRIEDLFSDESKGRLTLSTGHKSKGREWPTVVVLDPWLMPSKRATQPWQLEQEENLIYVVYTRAKDTLILMEEGWR